MTTIKSYTDIEESKKLTEILPTETADGFYEAQHNPLTDKWEYILFTGNEWASEEVVIPCWSLAALLSVLSVWAVLYKETDEHKMYYTGEHRIYYYVEAYMKRMGKEINLSTKFHENSVDACYEMIIELHKRKIF